MAIRVAISIAAAIVVMIQLRRSGEDEHATGAASGGLTVTHE